MLGAMHRNGSTDMYKLLLSLDILGDDSVEMCRIMLHSISAIMVYIEDIWMNRGYINGWPT